MQLKYILMIVSFILSGSALAYECKANPVSFKFAETKKIAFQQFSKESRQELVEALLYGLTTDQKGKKNGVEHTLWLLDYLENTEFVSDKQALFKLLRVSSDIETKRISQLNLNEICDLMEKVNKLRAQ